VRVINGLLIAMVITGCAGGPYPTSSPFYNIPVGTQIVVLKSLVIPADSARVYLQHGKVVTPTERDQYEYNCWFLSWKVKETVQTIEPDNFIVSKVQHTDFYVQYKPLIQLAMSEYSNKYLLAMGGATATEYTTELSIHSDNHPDIRQLVCSYWGDPRSGVHITVPQMKAVLGDIAQIRIKPIQQGDY